MIAISEFELWTVEQKWRKLTEKREFGVAPARFGTAPMAYQSYLTPAGHIIQVGFDEKGHIKDIGMIDSWEEGG